MKTLLFIDDDIGPLQYLVDIFEMKYNVETAESIQSALDKLANPNFNFDLIISDWHLGGDITALNLFKALGESKYGRYSKVPIIVVSSDEDNKRWVEKQNATFVLKPAKPSELLALVAEKTGM
jgi:DNA-binding NtrC family response regulator